MTMTDPIADMLTRIRNANVALHDKVRMPSSKQKEALARILQQEGYISGFDVVDEPGRPGKVLTIQMKYTTERSRTIRCAACRSRGCGSTRRQRRCRVCSAVWALPSSPRARGS
jgi:ribosomal protein S8